MIALVAIGDAARGPRPPDPIRSVVAGRLRAFYVPADDEPATVAKLEAREELLERLLEARDLLPVRYGATVEDEATAARILAERQHELVATLERVRGAVELSLRVRAVERRREGRDQFVTRLALARAAQHVHERLTPLARAATAGLGGDLLRAAYLVDACAIRTFVAEVRRAQAAWPELALLCTGPWPPFSFAGTRS